MPPKIEDRYHLLDQADAAARYLALRRGGFLAPARRLDAEIRAASPLAVEFEWSTEASSATSVGRELWLFDRELRRAVAIVQLRKYESLPRPISIGDGGLAIRTARAGSASFGLEPWGLVAGVLLSNPVQLALTVHQLLGGVRWVAIRLGRLGATGEGQRDVVLELPGKLRARAPVGATLRIELPDGTKVEVGPVDGPPHPGTS